MAQEGAESTAINSPPEEVWLFLTRFLQLTEGASRDAGDPTDLARRKSRR
jgi:hypothetical protein